MVVRILAWIAVIFGGAVTFESTFIAHRPNLVWVAAFLVGIGYFAKNGFMKRAPGAPPASEESGQRERADGR